MQVLTNLEEQAIRTEFKNAFKEDFFHALKRPQNKFVK